jgi:hypothetical protein
MQAFLILILKWIVVSFVARALIGAGLAFASVSWVESLVESQLTAVRDQFPLIAPQLIDLLGLLGVWTAVNWIGSAVIAGAAILAAKNALLLVGVGVGVAASGGGE